MGEARTRPSAPNDQRTASTYIFGAICPAQGKGAGLVLPRCSTQAMSLHLAEISTMVAPGAHAILVLDKAGWHISKALEVPDNITLVPLPPSRLSSTPSRTSGSSCGKLAVEPDLHILRRHPRPLLRGLEQVVSQFEFFACLVRRLVAKADAHHRGIGMAALSEIAGDIAAAGSAISGLLLVYAGLFRPDSAVIERKNVGQSGSHSHGEHGFALFGLILCLLAVGSSIFANGFVSIGSLSFRLVCS